MTDRDGRARKHHAWRRIRLSAADVDTQAVADAMTGIAISAMRRVLRGELDVGGRDAVARTIAQLVTRGIAAS